MTESYSQYCRDGTQGALWGCPSELEEWSSSGSTARVQELTSVGSRTRPHRPLPEQALDVGIEDRPLSNSVLPAGRRHGRGLRGSRRTSRPWGGDQGPSSTAL